LEKANIKNLKELIDLFEHNIKQYKGKHYDEAKTRVDFIDKFFMLLGWDVYNEKDYSEQYREVVREDRVEIKGKVKAPDYSFRIGGVYANKPGVKTLWHPELQNYTFYNEDDCVATRELLDGIKKIDF
jgi:hypothetical protein